MNIRKKVISVGNFDGLHIAHKNILDFIKRYAKYTDCEALIYTFENHPKEFFTNESVPNILLEDEKKEMLSLYGVNVFIRKFDKYFANLSAEDFILHELISEHNLAALVIGDDHKFGKGRHCGNECLKDLSKKYNFEYYQLDSVFVDGERVSSTAIRNHIKNGNILSANKMLGYRYFVRGKVIAGTQIGRKIGFPTANIKVDSRKLLPQIGVYSSICIVDGRKYPAMLNIGYKPTVSNDKKVGIEVHIIDFYGDLYEKNIKVKFLQKIRDEKQFNNIEELKNQLIEDKKVSLKIYQNVLKKKEIFNI